MIISDNGRWQHWTRGGAGGEETEFLFSSQDLDHLLHHTHFRTPGNFQVQTILFCFLKLVHCGREIGF